MFPGMTTQMISQQAQRLSLLHQWTTGGPFRPSEVSISLIGLLPHTSCRFNKSFQKETGCIFEAGWFPDEPSFSEYRRDSGRFQYNVENQTHICNSLSPQSCTWLACFLLGSLLPAESLYLGQAQPSVHSQNWQTPGEKNCRQSSDRLSSLSL